MKCECGVTLFSNAPTEITCRCGKVHLVAASALIQHSLATMIVMEFRNKYGLANCGCQDAAAFAQRWGSSRSRASVGKLVEMVFAKTPEISRSEIETLLLEIFDKYDANTSTSIS